MRSRTFPCATITAPETAKVSENSQFSMSTPGPVPETVVYHAPCQQQGHGIGKPALDLLARFRNLDLEFRPLAVVLFRRDDDDRRRVLDVAVFGPLSRVVEERRHLVELALRERVELVGVADGAAGGQVPHLALVIRPRVRREVRTLAAEAIVQPCRDRLDPDVAVDGGYLVR